MDSAADNENWSRKIKLLTHSVANANYITSVSTPIFRRQPWKIVLISNSLDQNNR